MAPDTMAQEKPLVDKPHRPEKISIVMPVRNGQDRIVQRVSEVIRALNDFKIKNWELVIVDDGSIDGTAGLLQTMASSCERIRVVRHGRPRGMEAAGQTGLERSTGNLVFIQESDANIRIEDFRTLLSMSEDESIVAARTESCPRVVTGALIRRLRAIGTDADQQFDVSNRIEKTSLQMIRRPHLQRLVGPQGHRYRLTGETRRSEKFEKLRQVY